MDVDTNTTFFQFSIKKDEEDQADEKDQTIGETERNHRDGNEDSERPLDYPSLSVTAEDVTKSLRDARRLTSGGFQQITP